MRNTHIADHLTVAKLAAIAERDTILAYLIDMALLHHNQSVKPHRTAGKAA